MNNDFINEEGLLNGHANKMIQDLSRINVEPLISKMKLFKGSDEPQAIYVENALAIEKEIRVFYFLHNKLLIGEIYKKEVKITSVYYDKISAKYISKTEGQEVKESVIVETSDIYYNFGSENEDFGGNKGEYAQNWARRLDEELLKIARVLI